MKILSKGMLLLSQLFQNPGSSILPIFSTHSYFNNIAKNISCFIKILHTCLDVFIVLFPNSKFFFQHTVCKYCCSEKIMESFSKGPLLLVRVQFSAYIMIAFKYSHWEKTFINILLLYIHSGGVANQKWPLRVSFSTKERLSTR